MWNFHIIVVDGNSMIIIVFCFVLNSKKKKKSLKQGYLEAFSKPSNSRTPKSSNKQITELIIDRGLQSSLLLHRVKDKSKFRESWKRPKDFKDYPEEEGSLIFRKH